MSTHEFERRTDSSMHRVAETVAGFEPAERGLWLAVLLALVVDVHLTSVGIQQGLAEGNPAMRAVIQTTGIGGLLGAKLLAVAAALAFRLRQPQYRLVLPAGIALPWFLAAGINAMLVA